VSDRDMVFFSLPVCDINNAPMMDTTAYDRCESAKCRFNYLLLCRCAGNYEKAYNSKGGENNKQFHGEAFPYNVLATTCDAFMQYDL
jgi:hypothetical protein